MVRLLLLLCTVGAAYVTTGSLQRSQVIGQGRRLIGFALVGSRNQRSGSDSEAHIKGTCPTDHRLDEALAVCLALDHHWNVSTVADLEGYANERGAFSKHNQLYDETKQGRWFIEEQYYGFMFVQAGLAFNNSRAIDLGLRIFDWGFDQQQPDGSFRCKDNYHSSGFFMEAVARAALLLRHSPLSGRYQAWIKRVKVHLSRLVDWFLTPKMEAWGLESEAPHTHRRFLTGTGIGLIGRLTENASLIDISWKYISSGLAQQDPSGFNMERGGYDCSYQGIGLVYAARYYIYVADTEFHRAQLLKMAKRGATWLVSRIHKDGTIETKGNTRTGLSQEVGRDGKPKALAKRDIVQALLYWGWIFGNERMVDVAWRVEEERTGSMHRPCSCQLDARGRWLEKNMMRCELGLCGKEIKVMSESRATFAKRLGKHPS